jgi:hypothetical protein
MSRRRRCATASPVRISPETGPLNLKEPNQSHRFDRRASRRKPSLPHAIDIAFILDTVDANPIEPGEEGEMRRRTR